MIQQAPLRTNQQIAYIHGWGMASSFWNLFIDNMPQHRNTSIDLGFQGHQQTYLTSLSINQDYDYVIAHSLGGNWALQNNIIPRKGFIFINSFYRFTDFTAPQILSEMQIALDKNAALQMQIFLKRADCLSALDDAEPTWNVETLKQGLKWLKTWDNYDKVKSLPCPTLILAGDQDRICPLETMQKHWEGHTFITKENGSHALPLSDAQWCADQITAWINQQNS